MKLAMRVSVWITELLVYVPAVYLCCRKLYEHKPSEQVRARVCHCVYFLMRFLSFLFFIAALCFCAEFVCTGVDSDRSRSLSIQHVYPGVVCVGHLGSRIQYVLLHTVATLIIGL